MNRLSWLWAVPFLWLLPQSAFGQVERVWLTHRSNDPSKLVVNWQTGKPGNSVVRYGLTKDYGQIVSVEENVTLHHVEIPLAEKGKTYHYSVTTGKESSEDATFKAYPTDTLRVAVVADWQAKPKLDVILKDDIHLLLTAGDNIDCLHRLCGKDVKDCTKPVDRRLSDLVPLRSLHAGARQPRP